MFWKRHDGEPELRSTREVPEYIRERLRLAFEFATLGAYEEREQGQTAPQLRSKAPEVVRASVDHGGRPRPQPARQSAPCAEVEGPPHCDALHGRATAKTGRYGTRRRAGTPVTPEQPCVWQGPGARRSA